MTRMFPVVAAALLACGCVHAESTDRPAEQKPAAPPPVNEARPLAPGDAEALADFNTRIEGYVKVHQKAEGTLPDLPKETTPEVVDRHQRALEKLMRAERAAAKPGDLLTPPVQRLVRQVLARVFSGKAGQEMKATILDENPGPMPLTINGRYPDEVPLSTVPPQVLSALPKLPEELEYRFVGERLVLLDVHAHTIADYMNDAFPR